MTALRSVRSATGSAVAVLATLCGSFGDVWGQAPAFLVHDINTVPVPVSSFPRRFFTIGSTTYFVADTEAASGALWKTDGSEDGTIRLTPGFVRLDYMTDVGGKLFFVADDGTGPGLWKSDATLAGTELVEKVPGITPELDLFARKLPFVAVDDTLFFTVVDGTGFALWRSDGSAAGTAALRSFDGDASQPPPALKAVHGILLFIGGDAVSGYELWRSDGTEEGTVLVKDINPGPESSFIEFLDDLNGNLLFVAYDGAGMGGNLWRTDGSEEGTVLVSRIVPSLGYSGIFANVNGTMFLSAFGPGASTPTLWKTNGTAAGTLLVSDDFILPTWLTDVDGTLFFIVYSGAPTLQAQLWKSDGTTAGTRLVKNIGPLDSDQLTAGNGRLFFRVSGRTPWASDGTADGTVPLGEFPISGDPYFTAAAGTVFFLSSGNAIAKTDGTAEGTASVASIGSVVVGQAPFVPNDGSILFAAAGRAGVELWKSDGAGPGTTQVANLAPEDPTHTQSSAPSSLINVNGTLFFVADDGTTGAELWRSDGTAAGTVLVKDINPGAGSGFNAIRIDLPRSLAAVGDTLFFAADDGETGRELWKSDGTALGTVVVKDITPGPDGSSLSGFAELNGDLFFVMGTDLWRSNGTEDGTSFVAALGTASDGVPLADAAAFDGTLFVAMGGLRGNAVVNLWKSDGTPTGTVLVKSIEGIFTAGAFAGVDDLVFFTTYRLRGPFGLSRASVALWQTDGTAEGTAQVVECPFCTSASVNGSLYFSPLDDLFRIDGQGGAPELIRNLDLPSSLSAAGERLVFEVCTAFEPSQALGDCEVWESDGTAGGTRRLADVVPGEMSSNPGPFTLAGPFVYFPATDEARDGTELWAIPLSSFGNCGDGTPDADETCDTSGESATCDADCTAVACGDGRLNVSAGETCDDGNAVDGDCCTPTCSAVAAGEICGSEDVCNGTPTCDGEGACLRGEPLDCDDGNVGTLDTCDARDGCLHTAIGHCVGDCSGDAIVSVDELVLMVAGALANSLDVCGADDPDGNGRISVAEVVLATRDALSGCY